MSELRVLAVAVTPLHSTGPKVGLDRLNFALISIGLSGVVQVSGMITIPKLRISFALRKKMSVISLDFASQNREFVIKICMI